MIVSFMETINHQLQHALYKFADGVSLNTKLTKHQQINSYLL